MGVPVLIGRINTRLINLEEATEDEVLFVLAKIRKILEIERSQLNMSVLNFYCNWALHPVMDKKQPDEIVDMIAIIKSAQDGWYTNSLVGFEQLFTQMREFCLSHGLHFPTTNDESALRHLRKVLVDVYSDTYIILKEQKLLVSMMTGGSFRITKYESDTEDLKRELIARLVKKH